LLKFKGFVASVPTLLKLIVVFTVSLMLVRGGGDASSLLLFLKMGKGGDL
jgi:hypothetical protein